MSVLGIQSVTLLKDNATAMLKAGDVVSANCWLGMDAYQPCAEVVVDGKTVGLGRMDYGAPWRFTDDATQAQYARHLERGLRD